MSRPLVAASLAFAFLACGHPQQEGRYALRREHVIRDDCGRADDPEVEGTLDLLVVGETVRLDYSLFEMQLWGTFLSGVERFTADGSAANVATLVNGRQCLLDQITTHLDATAQGTTGFSGTLAIRFEAASEACRCELWLSYAASLTAR